MPTPLEVPREVPDRPAAEAAAAGAVGRAAPSPVISDPPSAVRNAVRRLRREHERHPGPPRFAASGPGRLWPSRPAVGAVRQSAVGEDAAEDAAPGALTVPLARFRATITRYVRRLRAEGARPEQMLVRVKACVREAMAAEGWADPEAVQALTSQAVGWSIAAYYDR